MPLLESISLLDERPTPSGAAWNMAMDEALLMAGGEPVLRVYRWAEPAVSFGYFLEAEAAAEVAGSRRLMRRWTGGGIVEHGADFTWSLIVPAGVALSRMRPVESYAALHGAVAAAMSDFGLSVECVAASAPVPVGGLCFRAPAPGDLLWSGKKVAGAGQRRCRHGLLHQGSISGIPLPCGFPDKLAFRLADRVLELPSEAVPIGQAAALVHGRYGAEAWLRLR